MNIIKKYFQSYLNTKENNHTRKTIISVLGKIINEVDRWDKTTVLTFILENNGWSDNSKNTVFRFTEAFNKYLFKNGIISEAFSFNIEETGLNDINREHLKESPTAEQWSALKSSLILYNNKQFEFCFKFIALNGCRLGEIYKLDFKEFNKFNNWTLTIEANKKNNSRPMYLNEELQNLLSAIDYKIPQESTLKNWFVDFKNFFHNKYPEFINFNFTAHVLRVKFITESIEKGFTPVQIQSITGHKNIETILKFYNNPDINTKVNRMKRVGKMLFNENTLYFTEENFINLQNLLITQDEELKIRAEEIKRLNELRTEEVNKFKLFATYANAKKLNEELTEMKKEKKRDREEIEALKQIIRDLKNNLKKSAQN